MALTPGWGFYYDSPDGSVNNPNIKLYQDAAGKLPMYSYSTLSPSETAMFAGTKLQAKNAYKNALAQINYNRSTLQGQRPIDQRNLAREWGRLRERLPGAYAGRGLLNSGIYGGALKNYGVDRMTSESDLARRYQVQLGQLSVDQQVARNSYNANLAAAKQLEAARRAETAASLRALG